MSSADSADSADAADSADDIEVILRSYWLNWSLAVVVIQMEHCVTETVALRDVDVALRGKERQIRWSGWFSILSTFGTGAVVSAA
jgi:hypothetical protein